MELALYGPSVGYYRGGMSKFGIGGDFITAPEISPLFSRCVARQCREVLDHLDGGVILELGAGSGVMAADILNELALNPPTHYWILELSGELRQHQRKMLAARVPQLLERVRWLDTLPEARFEGVIVGNEVLDALPVERFRITPRGPVPMHVGWQQGFVWREGPAQEALSTTVNALQEQLGYLLPSGYESEVNPRLDAWIASLAETMEAGALLFIDYGYPRRAYYHPQRSAGTLLSHYRHRAHDDILFLPGLQDITANVDFTALADAGLASGLRVAGYTSQSYFLFGCGLMDLLDEVDPADTVRYTERARQAKLLTLPGEMGERFKAMALTKKLPIPLRGFSAFDERTSLGP
jgi:SAM-dependent MidA family methyltransferase